MAARLLIVGCGKMGEALLSGLLASGSFKPEELAVLHHRQERCDELRARYGVACYASPVEAPSAETVVLAVKPQVLRKVAADLTVAENFRPALVISIAAGITIATLEELFPGSSVVRVMPNTPLMVGQGMSVLSLGATVTEQQAREAEALFACMGEACTVPESMQDVVVAVSGSGPAYFALMAQTLETWAAEQGLDEELARKLAVQTLYGTGALLVEKEQTPSELITAVTSPGGTTRAALDAFEAHDFAGTVSAAAQAACIRSKELA